MHSIPTDFRNSQKIQLKVNTEVTEKIKIESNALTGNSDSVKKPPLTVNIEVTDTYNELTNTDTEVDVVERDGLEQDIEVEDIQDAVRHNPPPTKIEGVKSTKPKLNPETVKLVKPE